MHQCDQQISRIISFTFALLFLNGCASYKTPGGGADFAVFAEYDIKNILERKPASPWPVNIAVTLQPCAMV